MVALLYWATFIFTGVPNDVGSLHTLFSASKSLKSKSYFTKTVRV